MIVLPLVLAAAWAALTIGMTLIYMHHRPRPRNRRTHRLARFLSVSPSLTQPRNPHA